MRAVGFHSTALARQTAEAVRIMRRVERGQSSTPRANITAVISRGYS